jgi:hypothetical protein
MWNLLYRFETRCRVEGQKMRHLIRHEIHHSNSIERQSIEK